MPPRARAGDFRHIIIIQQPIKAADDMGGYAETFGTYVTTRAAIWPVSGKETVQSDKNTMEITHQLRIRYQSGILPSMRILFGSRIFEIITTINPDERGVLLDMMCKEDT